MLKRNLAKTGLIGNGVLLLIAAISVAATGHRGDSSHRATNDSSFRQLSFDTFLLKLNGSSNTTVEDMPAIGLNKKAVAYVKTYIDQNSELLEEIKAKSDKYFKITDAVFLEYGLPVELKYLAVIESELNTKARSRVGARGAWQLMPATARLLSLKITSKYDERTHFYKSTVAAAKYLRDLHDLFNDWLLVIAAYNSGPGRVYEAMKKSGSRNFWKMQNYLPAETRGHVKKFISTHYYFEEKGSVATLTREEVIAYRKLMNKFVEKQNATMQERQATVETASNNVSDQSITKTETSGLSKPR